METILFFKKCKKLQDGLEQKLELIEFECFESKVEYYEKCLMAIDIGIRGIKSMVSDFNFSTAADEIYFFKNLKPLFISQFIYYSKLLSMEAGKPNAGQKSLKEYYSGELEMIKSFYREHIDFYQYYRLNATFLDQKYFIRNQFDIKMKLKTGMYDYDEKFATSHDPIVAQILANDRLEKYLLKSIKESEEPLYQKHTDQSSLTWSASKVSLIELVYALYHMHCFNGGNIELSEVIKSVEKFLNTDLGNFHKTIFEIRNRKQGPTKFLHLITDNLNQHFMNREGE